MDFRDIYCKWCALRTSPLKECMPCPKYLKYFTHKDIVLDANTFCHACAHNNDKEMHAFCTTKFILSRRFR